MIKAVYKSSCLLTLFWLAMVCGGLPRIAQAQETRPDVVFILIDDLNDWVGYLGGHPAAYTPNIDRLAGMGVGFKNAHCQAPACNASRASMLLGRQPYRTGIYFNAHDWTKSEFLKDSLFSHFRANGYHVQTAGKMFHHQELDTSMFDEYFQPPSMRVANPPAHGLKFRKKGFDWGPLPEGKHFLFPDAVTVDWAIEALQKPVEQPRFLAIGLTGTHIPWYASPKWIDRFKEVDVQVAEVEEAEVANLSEQARLLTRGAGEHATITEAKAEQDIIRSYLACVSQTDEQVGRIIDAINSSPSERGTVIVLCSDHGLHFGEKNHWEKKTLWEETTRVPLIIVAPNQSNRGAVVESAVGLISIYPTLCELGGIPTPAGLDGPSLGPLLQDPATPWDNPVLTSLQKTFGVRSNHHRYIRYSDDSRELYDVATDPNQSQNLESDAALAPVIAQLEGYIPTTLARPGVRFDEATDEDDELSSEEEVADTVPLPSETEVLVSNSTKGGSFSVGWVSGLLVLVGILLGVIVMMMFRQRGPAA